MGGVRWRSSTMVIPQRSSQTDDQKADAAGQIVGVSESYKYDGEESRVHFELRSERSRMYQLQVAALPPCPAFDRPAALYPVSPVCLPSGAKTYRYYCSRSSSTRFSCC